jgi:hypothetical protein
VRIKQLNGWPPSRFQAAEERGLYAPPDPGSLQLQAASLVPSIGPGDDPEVFLLLKDPGTDFACSTRFKVKDPGIAIRIVRALVDRRDRTLWAIGEIEISEDVETFPGLKKVFRM